MRPWTVRIGQEWPLLAGALALLSLFLIPRAVRFGAPAAELEDREIEAVRQEIARGPKGDPEPLLIDFLDRRPGSGFASEARVLLAQTVLGRARDGAVVGPASLIRAWKEVSKLTPPPVPLRGEIAAMLLEYGFAREAELRLHELLRESNDPSLRLDRARALTREAASDPERRSGLLGQAADELSKYSLATPPEAQLRGFRAKADYLREEGKFEELLAEIVTKLKEARSPAEKGLLQMERGRTFDRLGRNMEAMAAFDDAEQLLADPKAKAVARLQQAGLFARAGNPEGAALCARILADERSAAPLALLVLGAWELKTRPAAALDTLRSGLSQVRRPQVLEDAGFDFNWIYAALRSAWERESVQDRLLRFSGLLDEIERLFPENPAYGFDHAILLLRARRFEEASDRYLALADSDRVRGENRERALRAAAEASTSCGLHRRAAALYRRAYDARPEANLEALFERGICLRRAGDAGESMAAFEDYVGRAGPAGLRTGAALLEKAALQAEGDRPEEALPTYDRILKALEVNTAPSLEDWARALLGRGRVLLSISRTAEARAALEEYVARYAPAPASLEAAWLLVRAAVAERLWKTALERIRELDRLASRVPDAGRAPYADLLKEARFVEGDLHFNLEDYPAAYRAYGEAYRKHLESSDRLWGLIGRARSLSRLERKEEARRDYANARAIFEEDRPSFEKSMGGHGREYWSSALDALAREVQ